MKILQRTIVEKVKIGDLFFKLGIEPREHNDYLVEFDLKIKTPYGYNKVMTLFTTEKQAQITTYFSNGKRLTTSAKHLLKHSSGEWRAVQDLEIGEEVITELGTTKVKKKVTKTKKKVLYDMSVTDVQCYYSNGILSHNSWCLISLGAAAVKLGYNVLHYTLELSESYVGKRYDACFSGVPVDKLGEHRAKVEKLINELPGSLIVKEYSPGKATMNTIESHIQKCTDLGVKPDLVLIDYVDLLRSKRKSTEKKDEIDDVYTAAKGLARELKIPVWTVSQVNRCHSVDDLVDTVEGKVRIGDIKPGDEVLTHKGFRKVTKVYPVEKQPAYQIKLKNGRQITVSANHYLPTQYGKLKSIDTGLKVGDKLFTKK